jgi:catechol 2,3-dioxygenase-like lactoylglutathione lyase family enzyme
VTDMDRSLRFYSDLGLELVRRSDQRAGGGSSAVLKVGDQEINVFSGAEAAAHQQVGFQAIDHFCLAMGNASIDDVLAGLRQVGIDVARGPIQRRDGTSVFVSDPDGIRVELILKSRT